MKRTLFIVSLIALASCSNDEIVNVPPSSTDEIHLAVTTGNFAKVTSRSAHTGNLNSGFKLWAVKSDNPADVYFSGEEITYSETDNTYSFAEGKRYWPSDDSNKLNFYAVHFYPTAEKPDNTKLYSETPEFTNSTGNPQFVINNVRTIADDDVNGTDKLAINLQDELLYAAAENASKSDNDGVVSLNFHHAMSKVQVEAKTTNSNLFVGIAHNGVTLCGFKDKGNVSITKNSDGNFDCNWTLAADASSKELTFNNDRAILLADYSENLSQKADYPALLIPQTSAETTDTYGSSMYLKVRCFICGLSSAYKTFNNAIASDTNFTGNLKLNLITAAVLTGVNATINGTTDKYGPYGVIIYGESVTDFSKIFDKCKDDVITSADAHLNVDDDVDALYKDIYIPLKNVDWQAGKSYCYNLNFDFEPSDNNTPVYDDYGKEIKNLYITVSEVALDDYIPADEDFSL